jgi:hypothetical protein
MLASEVTCCCAAQKHHTVSIEQVVADSAAAAAVLLLPLAMQELSAAYGSRVKEVSCRLCNTASTLMSLPARSSYVGSGCTVIGAL